MPPSGRAGQLPVQDTVSQNARTPEECDKEIYYRHTDTAYILFLRHALFVQEKTRPYQDEISNIFRLFYSSKNSQPSMLALESSGEYFLVYPSLLQILSSVGQTETQPLRENHRQAFPYTYLPRSYTVQLLMVPREGMLLRPAVPSQRGKGRPDMKHGRNNRLPEEVFRAMLLVLCQEV